MKQSRNLLAVIAGQSSVVAILVLVLILAVAGAPLLQQKKVVAESISTEVAITKAYALSEALLSHAVPGQSLDTFNQAFTALHFPGVLAGAQAEPSDEIGAQAVAALRSNDKQPFVSFKELAGTPHLFYAVPDRAGGALLIDLPMAREQATIYRFFGQSYLSSSALGYILVGLLLLGVFGLRHYLRSVIELPEEERRRHEAEARARQEEARRQAEEEVRRRREEEGAGILSEPPAPSQLEPGRTAPVEPPVEPMQMNPDSPVERQPLPPPVQGNEHRSSTTQGNAELPSLGPQPVLEADGLSVERLLELLEQ